MLTISSAERPSRIGLQDRVVWAADAVHIDTTSLSREEVVAQLLELVQEAKV